MFSTVSIFACKELEIPANTGKKDSDKLYLENDQENKMRTIKKTLCDYCINPLLMKFWYFRKSSLPP